MMKSGLLSRRLQKGWKRGVRFIPSLAPALVAVVVAALFFFTAMMDLKRLESLLLDNLKNKALYVLDVVHKSSHDKYRLLASRGEGLQSFMEDMFQDETLLLRELLAASLINAAGAIDVESLFREGRDEQLRDFLSAKRFKGIAILDEHGELVHGLGDAAPAHVSERIRDLVHGKRDIVFHLFQGMDREDYSGFVGLRKASIGKIVLLELDRKGLSYWIWKTALDQALQEIRWGLGVVYLVVEDGGGQVLAGSGSLPLREVEQCLLIVGSVWDKAYPMGQCVQVEDTRYLQLSMPFTFENGGAGMAKIGLDIRETDRLLAENRHHILGWTTLMVGIGLLAMGLFYGIQRHHMNHIHAMQTRLHQAEKLLSLGKLGAGVAHEIRNPLNAISLAVQRLQKEFRPDDPAKRERYERCTFILGDEIRRLNNIVEDFLSLSRTSRLSLNLQSMTELLDHILGLVGEEAASRGMELQQHFTHGEYLVWMDAHKMGQALLNILRNAMESMEGEGGGTLSVSCDEPEKGKIRVCVQDTGPGIPPGKENLIFDPFYTTRADGVGLGLAIAHEIIAAHGGSVQVMSRRDQGAVFEIFLPRGKKEA